MEVMRSDDDYFVNTADLSIKRLPPNKRTGIRDIIQHDLVQRIAGGVLVLLIILLWPTLRDILIDANILSAATDNLTEGVVLGALVSLPFALLVFIAGLRVMLQHDIPIYRNIIFIRDIIQVLFLLVIISFFYFLISNLQDNFGDEDTGLRINFNVLTRDFGVEVSQGPDYTKDIEWSKSQWVKDIPIIGDTLWDLGVELGKIRDDYLGDYLRGGTYTRAIMTGLYNTIEVVIYGLVFTTILGIFVGIGLLSGNWLVRTVSSVYVEIFRNTPLLVQLFLVYGVWTRILPGVRESIELPASFYLNNRGLNYPTISTTDTFSYFLFLTLIGFGLGLGLWIWRLRLQEATGKPANTMLYFGASLFGFALVGLLIATIAGGLPLTTEAPETLEEVRFNFERGDSLSSEFMALTLTLVLYTAAFIADIVRAGILSVPKGQIEAARAAGLTGSQTLRLVVLPQALRLIIPPLTNQYLNLSKNSSLAIAIGYVDLFNISNISTNQSGQAVVFFTVVLLIYLAMSLLISLVMNFANRNMRLQTR